MLITADVEAARRTEVVKPVHNQPYKIWDYIGDAPDPEAPGYGTDLAAGRSGGGAMRPQAYLVRQPPGSVTRPHFHQTNQFQVFVGGGGTVGKLRVDPVTVQYAAANTPYGPINAEAEGVDYFTLRQDWDSGAKWMPERRDVLVRGVQRQVVGVASGGEAVETLIAETADGLLALCIRLDPDAEATLPAADAGGGQYHVVTAGGLVRDGQLLGPLSVEFASPDAGAVPVKAGPAGLELVLARFPRA